VYDVDAKRAERATERSVRINGETYPRKPWTIGLDHQIEPLRQAIEDAGEEWRKLQFGLAQLDDRGEALPDSKRLTAAGLKKNRARMLDLDQAVIDARLQMIVLLVDKSETDGKLTVEILREHLEMEDLMPLVELLQTGEPTVGGPDPIGARSSD
jgi:hypothetical protein